MLRITLSALAVSLLALGPCATAAHAQPVRVFVAAQGSDSNPCSFAAPCRTFQHAHDVVAAGGEINVLDPAGYGAVTISKATPKQPKHQHNNGHNRFMETSLSNRVNPYWSDEFSTDDS